MLDCYIRLSYVVSIGPCFSISLFLSLFLYVTCIHGWWCSWYVLWFIMTCSCTIIVHPKNKIIDSTIPLLCRDKTSLYRSHDCFTYDGTFYVKKRVTLVRFIRLFLINAIVGVKAKTTITFYCDGTFPKIMENTYEHALACWMVFSAHFIEFLFALSMRFFIIELKTHLWTSFKLLLNRIQVIVHLFLCRNMNMKRAHYLR